MREASLSVLSLRSAWLLCREAPNYRSSSPCTIWPALGRHPSKSDISESSLKVAQSWRRSCDPRCFAGQPRHTVRFSHPDPHDNVGCHVRHAGPASKCRLPHTARWQNKALLAHYHFRQESTGRPIYSCVCTSPVRLTTSGGGAGKDLLRD